MSDIPVWNCEFAPLTGEGTVKLEDLTVGAKFLWKCHGDIAVQWDQQKPTQMGFAKPEDAYTLHILSVIRQDPNDVQYEVTAYKAGEHKPEYLRVLQGKGTVSERGFEAQKPTWTVRSVLDPKQQPQPFGPLGPWSLSLPAWWTASLIIGLLLLAYIIVRRLRKISQRRRMLEELQLHKTALPPLHQFYRDARQLRRRLHTVNDVTELKRISDDLDRDFRLYILRQFQIPTLDWSNQAILSDLRKRHRKTYMQASEPLKRTLRELMKLKARENVAVGDVEQMHRMSLDAAERLETARAQERGHA